MTKYRKKPVEIEAMHLTETNGVAVAAWCGGRPVVELVAARQLAPCVYIDTLEGSMRADVGDWVIRGVAGEFYPCKPDIFAATYDEVTE